MYRILEEEKLTAHRSHAKPATHRRPEPLTAYGPGEVWSWDITYLKSYVKGSYYYLYMVTDVFSRAIVAAEVHEYECNKRASDMVEDACYRERIDRNQLTLHSDNGGPMKGATLLATLQTLGVTPSYGRPGVCDDNPFSEALFRTMKYVPDYPVKPFQSVRKAQEWVDSFVHWYNNEHLHSSIKFVTPMQRHRGEDVDILDNRRRVYKQAKEKHPERWSCNTRNWERNEVVTLGSLTRKKDVAIKKAA